MTQQQVKRPVGRPSTGKGRKPSLNITVSQEVSDFLRDYGMEHNVSGFIERLVKGSQEWQAYTKKSV